MFTIGLVACNYVVKLQADDSSNDYSASSFYQVVLKLKNILLHGLVLSNSTLVSMYMRMYTCSDCYTHFMY